MKTQRITFLRVSVIFNGAFNVFHSPASLARWNCFRCSSRNSENKKNEQEINWKCVYSVNAILSFGQRYHYDLYNRFENTYCEQIFLQIIPQNAVSIFVCGSFRFMVLILCEISIVTFAFNHSIWKCFQSKLIFKCCNPNCWRSQMSFRLCVPCISLYAMPFNLELIETHIAIQMNICHMCDSRNAFS